MENASKALLMAAEILIGVMIISIGVYLFSSMGEYSADIASDMQEAQITEFNNQFLKYYGTTSVNGGEPETIKCTIHDIVGVINLAQKINEQNGFTEIQPISDSTYYIQIDLQIGARTYRNLEAYDQSQLVNLIKNNSIEYITDESSGSNVTAETKYFVCPEMPGIGEITRLVNYMKFVEI